MTGIERMQVLPDPLALARQYTGQARTVETQLRAQLAYERELARGQPAFRDNDYVDRALESLTAKTRAAIRLRKRWEQAFRLLGGEED